LDFLFNLLPHIVNGLSLGLLFALIALGFMLIIGVMELINLAHGSLFALGAYMAMLVITPDAPWLDAWLALPLPLRYALALVIAPAAAHLRRGAGARGGESGWSGARSSRSCRCPIR
jgi:branched-chain amino acid transport system permease protein